MAHVPRAAPAGHRRRRLAARGARTRRGGAGVARSRRLRRRRRRRRAVDLYAGCARRRLCAVRRGLRLRDARSVPLREAGDHRDRLRRHARVRRRRSRTASSARPSRRRSARASRSLAADRALRRTTGPAPDSRARGRSPGTASWSGCLADPSTVSIVIPALNEEDAIGDVVSRLRAEAPWHEDPRRRRRLERRDGATGGAGRRATSCAIRTTKATARRSRPASAARQGEFVLIIDADGQHHAVRCAPPRAAPRRVRPGRSARARRRRRRPSAGGSATQLLNRLASYLTGRLDSRSDVGLPRRAPRVPARVPAPAAERLLDADDHDARVHQGRLQRRVRAGRRAARASGSRRSGSRATARRFFLILLKVITIFSPLRIFVPISVASLLLGVDLRRRELRDVRTDPERRRHPDSVRRRSCFSSDLISEQISSLRFDGPSRS